MSYISVVLRDLQSIFVRICFVKMAFNEPSDQFLMENVALWDSRCLGQLFIDDSIDREIYSPEVEDISMDEDDDNLLVKALEEVENSKTACVVDSSNHNNNVNSLCLEVAKKCPLSRYCYFS